MFFNAEVVSMGEFSALCYPSPLLKARGPWWITRMEVLVHSFIKLLIYYLPFQFTVFKLSSQYFFFGSSRSSRITSLLSSSYIFQGNSSIAILIYSSSVRVNCSETLYLCVSLISKDNGMKNVEGAF